MDYSLMQNIATDSWVKSMWKFITTSNLKLKMVAPPLKETKKQDVFLMQEFINKGYKNSQLVTLNICRKHLQIITLGDITVTDGSIIHPDAKYDRKSTVSTSIYKWPFQPSPDDKSWKLWRRALKKPNAC